MKRMITSKCCITDGKDQYAELGDILAGTIVELNSVRLDDEFGTGVAVNITCDVVVGIEGDKDIIEEMTLDIDSSFLSLIEEE